MIPPLLARDCAAQAAQPRTWLLRTAYVGATLAVAAALVPAGGRPAGGEGAAIFDTLLDLQMAGVALVLPVLVAPLVAAEEERGTLDLVRTSPLHPRSFLLQLLAGRLAGMALLVLGGLPAAALAYSLGGLGPERIAGGLGALLAWSLLVAAVALRCACKHRSVRTALLRTYLWLALLVAFAMPLAGLGWNLAAGWAAGYGACWLYPWSAYAHSLGQVESLPVGLARLLPFVLYAWLFAWWALTILDRRLHHPEHAGAAVRRRWNPEQVWQRHRLRRLAEQGLDLHLMPGDRPLAWRELRRMPLIKLHAHPLGIIAIGGLALYILVQFLPQVGWSQRQSASSSFLLVIVVGGTALVTTASLAAAGAGDRISGILRDLGATPLPAGAILSQGRAGAAALRWRVTVVEMAIAAPATVGEILHQASTVPQGLCSLAAVAAWTWLWLSLCARLGQLLGLLVLSPAAALAAAVVVPLLLEVPALVDSDFAWLSPLRFLVWCDQGLPDCTPTRLGAGLALVVLPLALLAWWQHRHGETLIGRPAAG